MKVWVKGSGEVNLTQQHFVATGGQASVYVKDGTAYKIYTDPKDAIPDAKFRALSAIQDPNVIRPQSQLLNQKSESIGYTMVAIKDNYSLCQLFTRSFRDRNKITPDQILDVTAKLREHVANVHAAGILIVDLNELNILVPQAVNDTYLIDVDSYQTKGFPATVIMPSVRDFSVRSQDFSPLSDWYSYAILSFYLLVGAHPYKGTHDPSSSIPKDKQLEHRMRNNISAFRSDVRLPKCCYPIDAIPQNFKAWLKAVLEEGKRLAPPDPHGIAQAVVTAPVKPFLVASGNLIVTEMESFEDWEIQAYVESNGESLAMVSKGSETRILQNKRVVFQGSLSGETLIGFTPKMNAPVALNLFRGELTFYDLNRKHHEVLPFRAHELAKSGDRFYLRSANRVLEVEFSELANKTIVTASHMVADVLEQASHLFEGVVIQNMLGSVFVSLFPRSKTGYQVRIPELDKSRIVDAKFDGGVLMVIAANKGQYDRMVFRFSEDYTTYDLRTVNDITPSGLNFITLSTGICVSLTEDEKIEAFSSKKGSQGLKIVEDKALGNDMRLTKVHGKAGFTRGAKVYQVGLK